jgi:Pyruvate/2-oxoacid:ferredoxin oxidoreductase delta subunit
MEYTSVKDEGTIVIDARETSQLLEEEVQQAIAELSAIHIDKPEYKTGAESVCILCDAIEKHDKAITEQMKVQLQIAEANQRRAVDWGQMTPKIVGIVAYGCITCVLLCLERQTPMSMRWLRAMDTLIAPHSI